MEQSNKELIKEIADLFEDYEESYVPGEWEAFQQQQQKKKYPFAFPWLKVAAALFLISSVLVFSLNDWGKKEDVQVAQQTGKKQEEATSTTPPAAPNAEPASGKNNSAEHNALPVQSQVAAGRHAATPQPEESGQQAPANHRLNITGSTPVQQGTASPGAVMTSKVKEETKNPVQEQMTAAYKADQPAVHPAVIPADTILKPKKEKMNTSEFLLAESKAAEKKEVKKTAGSKWDFGLQVMPTATHSNTNIGAGLVTAYQISPKFSVSSGISLLQLGSAGNPAGGSSSSAMASPSASVVGFASDSRQLQSVQANIKAIDIPLGLVYKVNKHYFTSAGVSYFNILSEKRNNTYIQTAPVARTTTNPTTGNTLYYNVLETKSVEEPDPEQPLRGNSYIGFFNFSIGRRQEIFKQYNIQIEPFIKVPIGKLSAQDLNLLNSGVKFQLSF